MFYYILSKATDCLQLTNSTYTIHSILCSQHCTVVHDVKRTDVHYITAALVQLEHLLKSCPSTDKVINFQSTIFQTMSFNEMG